MPGRSKKCKPKCKKPCSSSSSSSDCAPCAPRCPPPPKCPKKKECPFAAGQIYSVATQSVAPGAIVNLESTGVVSAGVAPTAVGGVPVATPTIGSNALVIPQCEEGLYEIDASVTVALGSTASAVAFGIATRCGNFGSFTLLAGSAVGVPFPDIAAAVGAGPSAPVITLDLQGLACLTPCTQVAILNLVGSDTVTVLPGAPIAGVTSASLRIKRTGPCPPCNPCNTFTNPFSTFVNPCNPCNPCAPTFVNQCNPCQRF